MTALRRGLDSVLLLAALVIVWEGVYRLVGDVAITGPVGTIEHLAELFGRPRFWLHLEESLRAFVLALLISWIAGVGIGVWLGANRLAGEVAEPILVALYALPKVTLYPLILLLFGLGLSAKVAFGAIHGMIPVAIFAMNAVRNIRPVYLKTARVMRLDAWTAARTVLVPACLPEVVSGMRVGFSLTVLGVVIGEMFASQRGLGFMIVNSIGMADVATMMAVALLLFAFAGTANAFLLALDRRLHRQT